MTVLVATRLLDRDLTFLRNYKEKYGYIRPCDYLRVTYGSADKCEWHNHVCNCCSINRFTCYYEIYGDFIK